MARCFDGCFAFAPSGASSSVAPKQAPRAPPSKHTHNVGPAEASLGFTTEVIDAHAYVMPAFDAATGLARAEKLQRLQAELGTHHTFTMQLEPRRFVDNSSLVDPETLENKPVEWAVDELGRPCWSDAEGRRYVKGNCPPHIQTSRYAYRDDELVAAMDFADVQRSILHSYPSFGDLNPLHRAACARFPKRFARLVHFTDLVRPPTDEPALKARLDEELQWGGVAGLQFFTGWFQGDWDGAEMRGFWDHCASRGVAVWFTCVLGNPQQFTASAEQLFVDDYKKVAAWAARYPDSDVVLTHGLPFRSYVAPDRSAVGLLPQSLLDVFACPNVHVQLLLPLRLGDLFDFPFTEANRALEQLARHAGADKLLYGTDMPMVERYCSYSQSVLHIARYCTFLSPQDRALVLGGNAARLLARAAKSSPPPAAQALVRTVSPRVPLPATAGQRVDELETPCLCLDLDAFEHNCLLMNDVLHASASRGFAATLRPHAKAHKCSGLALKQLALHGAKAQGVCCQTVREAEAMVRGGVPDVLLTNLVASPQKAAKMRALGAEAAVSVCVDSPEGLALYEATKGPGRLGVMLEVGVACRTGAEPGDPGATVALARRVAQHPGLWLRGIQAYLGTAQHLRAPAERRAAVAAGAKVVQAHLAALRAAGVATDALVVSGGGTGTLPLEAEAGYQELQCGSYALNDVDYAANQGMHAWRQSLFVLGSVLGRYTRAGLAGGEHCVVDVGLKAVAMDSGPPALLGDAGRYVNLGDEHGAIAGPPGRWPVGTKLRLAPGHCDPTCNLHDFLVCTRGGQVVEVLPIDGRGS